MLVNPFVSSRADDLGTVPFVRAANFCAYTLKITREFSFTLSIRLLFVVVWWEADITRNALHPILHSPSVLWNGWLDRTRTGAPVLSSTLFHNWCGHDGWWRVNFAWFVISYVQTVSLLSHPAVSLLKQNTRFEPLIGRCAAQHTRCRFTQIIKFALYTTHLISMIFS